MRGISSGLLFLALLVASTTAPAQFQYTTNTGDGTLAITGYTGNGGAVAIPSIINGLTVTEIQPFALAFASPMTSLSIPGTITYVGFYAFTGCTNLTNVVINNGVLDFDALAFSGCRALSSVNFPASVTNIGYGVCLGCTGTTAITVDSNNSFYSSVQGVLFDKNQSTLIEFPEDVGESYTIPDGVTSIGAYAFGSCDGLTNISVPPGVTSLGDFSFAACTSLTSIVIPGSVTNFGDHAFYVCAGLTNVILNSGVSGVGTAMFYGCSNLASVALPPSVTMIGSDAFYQCHGLTSVIIPASVTTIGDYAYQGCSNLTSILFQGNPPSADATVFDDGTGTASLNATVFYLPGASGWNATFAGLAAVPWDPVIQTADGSFGARAGQFGFNITGASNVPVVVEASTDIASSVWTPLMSLALTNGLFYFGDPLWTNYLARFYRLSPP